MKELDLLLLRWLNERWPAAQAGERAVFEALLDLPDPQLAGYLLAHEPVPEDFRELVDQLRA